MNKLDPWQGGCRITETKSRKVDCSSLRKCVEQELADKGFGKARVKILEMRIYHQYTLMRTLEVRKRFVTENGGSVLGFTKDMWKFTPPERQGDFRIRLESLNRTEVCDHCDENGISVCDHCKGSGLQGCYRCNGSGVITLDYDTGKRQRCPNCNGTGRATCHTCNGSGKTRCTHCGGKKTMHFKYELAQMERELTKQETVYDAGVPAVVSRTEGHPMGWGRGWSFSAGDKWNAVADSNALPMIMQAFCQMWAGEKPDPRCHILKQTYSASQNPCFLRCSCKSGSLKGDFWFRLASADVLDDGVEWTSVNLLKSVDDMAQKIYVREMQDESRARVMRKVYLWLLLGLLVAVAGLLPWGREIVGDNLLGNALASAWSAVKPGYQWVGDNRLMLTCVASLIGFIVQWVRKSRPKIIQWTLGTLSLACLVTGHWIAAIGFAVAVWWRSVK